MNISTKWQKTFLFLSRIALGWLFFYAGITKVINPEWSSAGFLGGATNLTGFFGWLSSPSMLPFVDFLNQWGLTLLGISLILGAFVRLSSVLGAVLMILYYLPTLDFPYPDSHSYIVDEHIVYALILLFFAAIKAGRLWGLDGTFAGMAQCKKWYGEKSWLG
jgi:thiosulfate dehydrogenase (quinone) large subunit